MKKLMIAAASAAMISGVFASPQVYDVKLTVKTTTCKSAKLPKAIADLGWFSGVKANDQVAFRGTTTRTIGGLIWGCSCEGISRPSWRVEGTKKVGVGGYAFWDQTTSPYKPFQIPYTLFDWAVLNRVGKMTNIEGTWILGDSAKDEAFFFVGAGFGTVTIGAKDCDSYIKTMSGNFAGFAEYKYAEDDGCIFCGETSTDCLVAPFCVCDGVIRATWDLTACYGSWQMKYNASQSKKLEKAKFITSVRNFTDKKVAALGVALDAGYYATREAKGLAYTSLPDVNTNKMIQAAANAKAKGTDVTLAELKGAGKYYTTSMAAALVTISDKQKKNVDTSVLWDTDEGESKVTAAVSVAEAIIGALSHIEAAADDEDSSGDDWGDDDGGDDWGDDDGGDDWDF